MNKKQSIIINLIYFISTLAAIGLFAIISINKLLPTNYRYLLVIGLLTIYIIIGYLIIKKGHNKSFYTASLVFLILMLLVQSIGAFYIYQTFAKYNSQLDNAGTEKVEFSIITLKSNPVETINQIEGDPIFYDKTENIDEIRHVSEETIKANDSLEFSEGNSSVELAQRLTSGEIKYMILNTSKLSLITDVIGNFDQAYKVLSVAEIQREIEQVAKKVEVGESFNVFITGADKFDVLDTNSRSDVNIVLSINPNTHEVHMTSLPRDSYVWMRDLGFDKLTHAGVYGLSTLLGTVEDLLNTEINYYAKIDFGSMIAIVDKLGGITVDNDVEFNAQGYHFAQGEIHLDGPMALAFVRERYSFGDGDFARGRNQMKVLEGMINRATSSSVLLNYTSLLDLILNSVNTNIPTSKITEMLNIQLDTNSKWNITQFQVQGEPEMGLHSFAMPESELSMTVLDPQSIYEGHKLIQESLGQKVDKLSDMDNDAPIYNFDGSYYYEWDDQEDTQEETSQESIQESQGQSSGQDDARYNTDLYQ